MFKSILALFISFTYIIIAIFSLLIMMFIKDDTIAWRFAFLAIIFGIFTTIVNCMGFNNE